MKCLQTLEGVEASANEALVLLTACRASFGKVDEVREEHIAKLDKD
jgi:hypothetical protein